ncbi:MAG: HAD family hydrolase [bacterium]|nr:HAD family hydrolase [bacterium]
MNWNALKLLILDVDGVLTDGAVIIAEDGTGPKVFAVHDGCALKQWQEAGHEVAIISGRSSRAVERRAEELGISFVRQGCGEKLSVYESALESLGVNDGAVCYVGDDVPDLGPMGRCACPVAVANARPVVKQRSRYVTRRSGGGGAVAEVVELVLRKQGLWAVNSGL